MPELKPCPFCGSEDVVIKRDDSCGYTVICFKCNAKSDRCLSQKLAVEAWNRRVKMTKDYNDARYYLKKKGEMCNTHNCADCPLSIPEDKTRTICAIYEGHYPEEAIAAVREWHRKKYKEARK